MFLTKKYYHTLITPLSSTKINSPWQKYWGYDHYTLTRGEKSHITSNLIQLTLNFENHTLANTLPAA